MELDLILFFRVWGSGYQLEWLYSGTHTDTNTVRCEMSRLIGILVNGPMILSNEKINQNLHSKTTGAS